MMRQSIWLVVAFAWFASQSVVGNADVIDFEDLSLPPNSFYNGGNPNDPQTPNNAGWNSGGAHFSNSYDFFPGFGGSWEGWSYSNVNNTTTQGFGNQYAAFTGTGVGGSGNYAVSFNASYVDLPTNTLVQSARITNTTFAALTMQNGDMFSKKFGGVTGNDADFFKLTITGHSQLGGLGAVTGTQEFFLADYRFADNSLDYIVNTWQLVNLTGLGNAASLSFSLSSSDNGIFGMNTPAYFAMDNLAVTAVPEPSSMALVGAAVGAGAWIRRRARKRQTAIDSAASIS